MSQAGTKCNLKEVHMIQESNIYQYSHTANTINNK